MTSSIAVIGTSSKIEKEVVATIKTTLPKSMEIRERSYLQATAGVPLEVIEIVFIFTLPIWNGFLNELGKDAYQGLKKVLKDAVSKKGEQTLIIGFHSHQTELSFRLETDNPDVVENALERIPPIISKTNKSVSLYLDQNGSWKPFDGKVAFVYEGVAATTQEVEIRGEKIQLTEESLRNAARRLPDLPILVEHRGRPIGRGVKGWVKDGKLYVRIEVYEPRNTEENIAVERIKSGDLRGFSLGFSY